MLGGKTVYYASADTISDTLAYDMGQEREFNLFQNAPVRANYSDLTADLFSLR